MDVGKISAGQRVPNYRKLCELLGEPSEAGNSKKAQLRKWEQYFAYRREGNAYIITEVYPAPKASDDGRMKYAQNLIPILLHHMANSVKTEQSFERWYVTLGMIEETLFDDDWKKQIRDEMRLTPFELQKLVYTVTSICKRSLMSTLDSLKKDQVINHCEKTYVVIGPAHKLANKEEEAQLQSCKNAVMAEMGISSMFPVLVNPARSVRFYDMVNTLCKERYGWDRAYTLLEILPLNLERIGEYENADVAPMMEKLKNRIKSAATAKLRGEYESANRKEWEEFENGEITEAFKLEHDLVEKLSYILQVEV